MHAVATGLRRVVGAELRLGVDVELHLPAALENVVGDVVAERAAVVEAGRDVREEPSRRPIVHFGARVELREGVAAGIDGFGPAGAVVELVGGDRTGCDRRKDGFRAEDRVGGYRDATRAADAILE